MAAYAALVSLFNTLDQIQNHPCFSTSLDKYQIESLGTHIDFLLDFVEGYNIDGDLSKGAEELKRRIASAAHEAEDIVESHIVNQILRQSDRISDVRLHHRCLFGLQKVIQDMDSIKDKVLKIKEESGFNYEKPPNSMPAASSTPLITTEQNMMVGLEDELMQLKDVLIKTQSSRQIISIVGMGGTGKTTLAKDVYEDSLTVHHFDLRVWATISQEYNVRDILLQLLSVAEGTVEELGERLHKKLFGRRYLIVLDDMWSREVWDSIRFFFPDNGDGSRIILTTRLSNMAIQLCSVCIRINFLDENKSWELFCKKIFGQKDCPVELERIGKKIVERCEGLPLSIVVIGGLLKKSITVEYWQRVAKKNINEMFNSEEYGQCLDVLYLSYSHLPSHLKPCFLYMGTFKEDSEIRVSEIIKLWVAEGFLKPNGVQILEEMAEDYLKDLMDRNLILVCERRSNGRVKSFRMHDLLRELCLRVADKEEFFCVVRADSIPPGIERERLIVYHENEFHVNEEVSKAFQSASLARSLICNVAEEAGKYRLLRVLNKDDFWFQEAEFQNVNLRYSTGVLPVEIPSSISLIWNLQSLGTYGGGESIVAPLEIWSMTQLRHLKFKFYQVRFPDPPPSGDKDDSVVLRNLQTLKGVRDFKLSEEVCKRIPNIKKLHIAYFDNGLYGDLQNLGRLQRLESIRIKGYYGIPLRKLKNAFPSSIKKLSLGGIGGIDNWDDLSIVICSLPQLEVLKLSWRSFEFQEWRCVEGECRRLKYLSISHHDLKQWTLDRASYFPVLEKLVLCNVGYLNEIPSCMGEIPTLKLIHLEFCSFSSVISAMKIKEEQESFGNYDLQIQVKMISVFRKRFMERVEAEGLSINNIHLEII